LPLSSRRHFSKKHCPVTIGPSHNLLHVPNRRKRCLTQSSHPGVSRSALVPNTISQHLLHHSHTLLQSMSVIASKLGLLTHTKHLLLLLPL
jgi:hypothetical protein